MNHASTVCQRYIVVAGHIERLLVLIRDPVRRTLIQRLILLIFQVLSLAGLKYLVCCLAFLRQRPEHRIQKRFRHVISIAVHTLHLSVSLNRIHAESQVRRQRPGRRRPCQEIRILILHLETDNGRTFLHILISLRHLLRRQRGSAARTVRYDLEALIEQPLIPDLLKRPPLGLNKIIVIGNVWVLHIRPESDRTGEILPHSLIFPHTFLTFVNKRL